MPPPSPSTFTTIPILPLRSALSPATKPAFLAALRDALLNVGFLYLSETGLPRELVDAVVRECGLFFEALPLCEKEAVEMKRQRSFLGWSRVSCVFSFFVFVVVFFLGWVRGCFEWVMCAGARPRPRPRRKSGSSSAREEEIKRELYVRIY
jgi:hypothetical protein